MSTVKAVKQEVQIGNLSVDGYMLPDGSFGMSQAQIAEMLGIASSRFGNTIFRSKLGKALMEQGLVRTQNVKVSDRIKSTNNTIIDLDWIVPLLVVCGHKGFDLA